MKRMQVLLRQFNWRYLLVRLLVSALALVLTTALVPDIYFRDFRITSILIVVVGMGVLNAVVKPIIQFLTMSLFFATYGLVVAFINGILLYLLAVFFPDRYAVNSIFWAIVGGVLLALLGSFFESLLGLTVPIVPEDRTELRRQISEQTTSFGQLLIKARAERGKGLMGEEITDVLASGVAHRLPVPQEGPGETEALPPVESPPAAADGGGPGVSAVAAPAASAAATDEVQPFADAPDPVALAEMAAGILPGDDAAAPGDPMDVDSVAPGAGEERSS